MIETLRGKIIFILEDRVVIEVAGVGYGVFIDKTTRNSLIEFGLQNDVMLHVHQIVKEDGITIYGFLNLQTQMWFLELLKISGVSGRIALSVLHSVGVENMSAVVTMKDEKAFSSAVGVGAKLASRIVNEIKDISQNIINVCMTAIPKITMEGFAQSYNSDANMIKEKHDINKASDAIEALVSLGITRNIAYKSVKTVLDLDSELSVQDLIKEALKNTSR